MSEILIVDDEHAICQVFSDLLEKQGYATKTAASGEEAIARVRQNKPDLVLLDFQMPGMTGLETLQQIKEIDKTIPVVIMTAYGTMKTTMGAMRLGAHDFLNKPVELSQIRSLVKRILDEAQTTQKKVVVNNVQPDSSTIIANSPAMQEIFKLMGLLTTNDLSVLITGESGVGKELVARGIHFNSDRNAQPFVAVNCAAIPENLLESELFGYEKGAFTGAEKQKIGRFEAAASGTIFLDEIGELPLTLQSKLLRVLQERKFERVGSSRLLPLNARIIAATNRDLLVEIEHGRFREDLYYRLEMIKLNIPPLRERTEDIEVLAYHFVQLANKDLSRDIHEVEPEALEKLLQYSWPGNIRELEHTIKRAVLMSQANCLSVSDIGLGGGNFEMSAPRDSELKGQLDTAIKDLLEDLIQPENSQFIDKSVFHTIVSLVEKSLIDEALLKTENNQVAAAKMLGLHRTTLRNKIEGKGS